ncbi:hypothetical protein [Streptomyces sp. GS7]|uniref:hypothetical protein n=1 Tax=Streptomyces sp. GS7 TaxID=2692234 RepID=UPI00131810DF|nr:hypothetical protein [Streptomyces sp. GS7]QHC25425.1 hypothetical protein GR130_32625 [Streptomyces sp. GS7]
MACPPCLTAGQARWAHQGLKARGAHEALRRRGPAEGAGEAPDLPGEAGEPPSGKVLNSAVRAAA